MTTNGSLLAQHAQALRDAGLHRITVSLDALDPVLFRTLSGGRGNVEEVLAGIAAATAAGFAPVKLNSNTVNEQGNVLLRARSVIRRIARNG